MIIFANGITVQIYTIDLIGNLTGTSLITFMLCTVELMLAGLCINALQGLPVHITNLHQRATLDMERHKRHQAQGNLGLFKPDRRITWLGSNWCVFSDARFHRQNLIMCRPTKTKQQ